MEGKKETEYRFWYKYYDAQLRSTVISIKDRDNELAIEFFEKMYPGVVWRRFEIVNNNPKPEEPQIPLSESFTFAYWISVNNWEAETDSKQWIKWSNSWRESQVDSKTIEEIYTLFKETWKQN